MGNVFGECHALGTLTVDALKLLHKTKYLVLTQLFILVKWHAQAGGPVDTSLPSFLCSFYIPGVILIIILNIADIIYNLQINF